MEQRPEKRGFRRSLAGPRSYRWGGDKACSVEGRNVEDNASWHQIRGNTLNFGALVARWIIPRWWKVPKRKSSKKRSKKRPFEDINKVKLYGLELGLGSANKRSSWVVEWSQHRGFSSNIRVLVGPQLPSPCTFTTTCGLKISHRQFEVGSPASAEASATLQGQWAERGRGKGVDIERHSQTHHSVPIPCSQWIPLLSRSGGYK